MTTLASIRPHLAALATALAAATLSVPTIAAGPASVDYAALVEHHGAAVVHVSVREKLAKPDDGTASTTPPATQPSKAFGSGFIVSADGYILTNAHVVQHGTRIRVTLKDKRELAARIVGEDATTDVALLKVDAADLPAVRIGDPDRVRVGEPVAAIGSPFGFEHSVTAGIVSAKSRNVDDLLVPFIQTDAAINPGNSGGPLFNSAGEVIGINSRIWTRSGGFQGLSFAIPIDLAMRIADELRDGTPIERGHIGVRTQAVTTELARAFGLDRARGALLVAVDPDSPASRSGLAVGDIVLQAAGRPIESALDLQRAVGSQPLEAELLLDVLRDGEALEVSVTVASAKSAPSPSESISVSLNDRLTPLGVEVRRLSPQERQRRGLAEGLYVQSVSAMSPAVRADLKAGDLILQVGGRPVGDVTALREGLEAAGAAGGPVPVLTLRGEEHRFVALELD
ncbi:MAG: PDZ domain-containing protein [Burkholderiaceae bacterium]|nr:PDZ domain-containing protein [Burkholderiaceae bacterium]